MGGLPTWSAAVVHQRLHADIKRVAGEGKRMGAITQDLQKMSDYAHAFQANAALRRSRSQGVPLDTTTARSSLSTAVSRQPNGNVDRRGCCRG